jgi:plasmid stability protein
MGQMLIRNLDDGVIAALKHRAATEGISLEEASRRALASSVGASKPDALRRADELRRRIGRLPGPSSLEDLRADRARDEDQD